MKPSLLAFSAPNIISLVTKDSLQLLSLLLPDVSCLSLADCIKRLIENLVMLDNPHTHFCPIILYYTPILCKYISFRLELTPPRRGVNQTYPSYPLLSVPSNLICVLSS